MELEEFIRDVPDFPKSGILFKDITPLLQSPTAFDIAVQRMEREWESKVDVIAALDARGFIFGAALAQQLYLPFVPVRKKGKLPFHTYVVNYALEYGEDAVEIHIDAFEPKARVLIVDDLLATGGTAAAAGQLVEKAGGVVAGYAFVIELSALGGRAKLGNRPVQALISYE